MTGTHSQANSNPSFSEDQISGPVRFVSTVDKISKTERAAEEARRQRRVKRRTMGKADGAAAAVSTGDVTPDAATAILEAEKKTTKKERKQAETKFTEQQQHKSANEASRMALGALGNRFGGKKGRDLAWMKMGSSPAAIPGRLPPSGGTSTTGTPGPERTRAALTDKQFGQWDEEKGAKIQARDVLLVLESDGRASRSFVRGFSLPEKTDS